MPHEFQGTELFKDPQLGEFTHRLNPDTYKQHFDDFVYIYESITKQLSGSPNFDGVDFCDVLAGGITIHLQHKDVGSYLTVTLLYDFSNKEEVIQDAVNQWKIWDKPKYVSAYKDFLNQGNKYGWD